MTGFLIDSTLKIVLNHSKVRAATVNSYVVGVLVNLQILLSKVSNRSFARSIQDNPLTMPFSTEVKDECILLLLTK